MDLRFKTGERLKTVLRDTGKRTCMQTLSNLLDIKGYMRSGYFGNIYSTKFRTSTTASAKRVKIHDLTKTVARPEFIMKTTYNSKENVNEVKIMNYIKKNVIPYSPHAIIIYTHFVCDDLPFRGYRKWGVAKSHDDWEFVKSGRGIITFMEYAGKSLESYFTDHKNNIREQMVMLFQLVYTLCVFQKMKLLHGDIYAPNITYMKVNGSEKPQHWEYNVNDVTYNVPVKKYIPIFIDFGQSEIQKRSYVKETGDNDLIMLLTTWGHYSENETVKWFCNNIIETVSTRDGKQVRARYLDYTNVLADFFHIFEKTRKSDAVWTLNTR